MSDDKSPDARLMVFGLDPNLTEAEAVEELTNRVARQIEEEYGIVLADDPDGHDSEGDDGGDGA